MKINQKFFNFVKNVKKLRNNDPFYINKIRNDLSKHLLPNPSNRNLRKLYSQIIFENYVNDRFNYQLINSMSYNNGTTFVIPQEWLLLLSQKGIKINFFTSRVLYFFSSLIYLLKSIVKIIKIIFAKSKVYQDKKIYFLFDIADNISDKNNFKDEDFFLWLKNFLKVSKHIVFYHQNKNLLNFNKSEFNIHYNENYLFISNTFFEKLQQIQIFLKNLGYVVVKSVINQNLNNNFLFYEKTLDEFFKLKNIEVTTIFNDISRIIKPLWINNHNVKSYILLYSANNFNILAPNKISNNYINQFGSSLYTWKNYILYCQSHFTLLRKDLSNYEYNLLNGQPFPYEGKSIDLNSKQHKDFLYMSIFPVDPIKLRFLEKSYRAYNYYTYKNVRLFLEKSLNFLKLNKNYIMYFKTKRFNKKYHVNYINSLINNLDEQTKKRVIILNYEISSFSIIKASDLVISVPYTSTAHIAKKLGKKTYYFDPTDTLDKENIQFNEIPLITSLENII